MARDLGADQIDALQGKPGVKVMSIASVSYTHLDVYKRQPEDGAAFWRGLLRRDSGAVIHATGHALAGQY